MKRVLRTSRDETCARIAQHERVLYRAASCWEVSSGFHVVEQQRGSFTLHDGLLSRMYCIQIYEQRNSPANRQTCLFCGVIRWPTGHYQERLCWVASVKWKRCLLFTRFAYPSWVGACSS
jgi:hypothetical protein